MEVGKIRKENRTRREDEKGKRKKIYMRTEKKGKIRRKTKERGKGSAKRIEEEDIFDKTKKENIHMCIASSFGNTPKPQMRVKLSYE